MEASSVFGLFYVIKRAWGDGIAAGFSAVVFVTLPLTNLLFSDGGYPGIVAQWLLVATMAALAALYPRLNRWSAWLGGGLVLGLALLAHTAITLLLGTQLLVFILLVARFDRSRLGSVLAWGGVGSAIAFFSYYLYTVPLVFGEILPSVWQKLRAGTEMGKDSAKLGAPLLSGFWPQIAAHFQVWPFTLGLAGYAQSIGRKAVVYTRQRASVTTARRGITLWLGSGLVSFGLYSLLDLRANLLQKHMEFSMPLLAILSALVLGRLWRMAIAGRLLVGLLVAVLAWASINEWVTRVLFRTLPPGSG